MLGAKHQSLTVTDASLLDDTRIDNGLLLVHPSCQKADNDGAGNGVIQNSQSCPTWALPAKSAGPVLRAGFTDVLVTGIAMR